MTPYIIFRVVIALLLGAIVYSLDRRFGRRPYRWWYGMTHEQGLPADVSKGFVYNRETKTRAFAAMVLSTLTSFLAIRYASSNALTELILWAVTIPAVVVGFLLGPYVSRLWQKRDEMFQVVDKIESGEIDLSSEVKTRSVSFWGRVGGWFSSRKRKAPAPAAQEKPAAVAAPAADPASQTPQALPSSQAQQPQARVEEADARELMDKYIRKRTGRNGN